jgi:hypothetical protein
MGEKLVLRKENGFPFKVIKIIFREIISAHKKRFLLPESMTFVPVHLKLVRSTFFKTKSKIKKMCILFSTSNFCIFQAIASQYNLY